METFQFNHIFDEQSEGLTCIKNRKTLLFHLDRLLKLILFYDSVFYLLQSLSLWYLRFNKNIDLVTAVARLSGSHLQRCWKNKQIENDSCSLMQILKSYQNGRAGQLFKCY